MKKYKNGDRMVPLRKKVEKKKVFIFLRSMSWLINIPETGVKGFILP